ncbi:MAG: hypothetical protein AAFQ82_24715, partial [Myxococcota bacterium]
MRHSVFAAALSFAALSIAPASAMGQAATVQSSAGDNGIKLGEGRLHPYAQADTHFVVNPGRLSDQNKDLIDAARDEPLPGSDGYVALTAGLDYDLPSPTLELKFGSSISRNQYFQITELNGWNADVKAGLTGFKDGPFEYRLNAGYIRSQQPGNQVVRATVDHNDFTGGAGITFRPGGGALTLSADYSVYYQRYDNSISNQQVLGNPLNFNSLQQSPSLRASWSFLPKTQLFVEANADITRYPDEDETQLLNFNATNLETYIGLNGALTTRFSVLAKIGYGNPFTRNDDDFIPVVGHAEIGYYLSSVSKVNVGFYRRTTPQPLFGFVAENTGYARWDQQIGKVQVNASVEGGQYSYGVQQDASNNRIDNGIQFGLGVSYPMNDWLTLAVSESLEFRTSNNDQISFGNGEDASPGIDFGFFTNDIFLRLS